MAAKRRRRAYPKKHAQFLNRIRPHYDRLLEEQGGVCGICHRPPSEHRRLDIDHHWGSMTYRGLACASCNIRLGNINDPEWFRAAADYLERPTPDWLLEELKGGSHTHNAQK